VKHGQRQSEPVPPMIYMIFSKRKSGFQTHLAP